MIHLKYKCEVRFVKLPLIWIDLCLKLVFENATAGRNTGCRSVVNCASCSLQLQLTFWCGLRHPKCDQAMHLALPPSHCKPVLSSIPIHNNPVGLSLETWLANGGDRNVQSIARGIIVQEICNATWRMRRSSVVLEIHTTSFIQRHILQKLGQFLL